MCEYLCFFVWLLSDMGEGQYYKFIPDQAVVTMGIVNYASSDLLNSSGAECLVGLFHLHFWGLICCHEVWDGWINHRILFCLLLPGVVKWDLCFFGEQICFVGLIYMQVSWTLKEAGIKVISTELASGMVVCLAFLSNYWWRNSLESALFAWPLSLSAACLGDCFLFLCVFWSLFTHCTVLPCCHTASLVGNPDKTGLSCLLWLGGTAEGLLASLCLPSHWQQRNSQDSFNLWAFTILWSVKLTQCSGNWRMLLFRR